MPQPEKALGRMWGVEYGVAMDGYPAKFKSEASGTRPPSQLDAQVIKLLWLHIDVLAEKLAYRWLMSRLLSLWSP